MMHQLGAAGRPRVGASQSLLPQSPFDLGLAPPPVDPVAQILAEGQRPPAAQSTMTDPAQSDPFIWGQGGQRISQGDIDLKRKIAAQKIAAGCDFSPIGHWTQGLARVAQGVVGGLEMRAADKQAKQKQAANDAIIAALMNPTPTAGQGGANQTVAAALMSDDPAIAGLGQKMWDRANPKPTAPHYFQDNAGNEWAVGGDGQPQMLHQDNTPKYNFIPDGMGGGSWVPLPMQASGGSTSSAPALPAIGAVMADPRTRQGGGAGNSVGGFR